MMTVRQTYERLHRDGIAHHPVLFLFIGIVSFFFILTYYFLNWPIIGYDTDLWYHLSGGRYFWQNGTIVRDAFFSYIAPPKSWYNYYWLFQAIVYKTFQGAGYYGLIVLRCLLAVLTALFIGLIFVNRHDNPKGMLMGLFVFMCYPIALTFRELLVRPHLFSYLFIVVFLYILERKREKIWLLPLLGLLWCNIHGIEYPVMILIVLSYLAEMYYEDMRRKIPCSAEDKRSKWFLILTVYTVFLTPQIVELIKTPFTVSYGNALYQHLYIAELIPLDLGNIFIFPLFPFSNLIISFQHLLVIATGIVFSICIGKRAIRISHIILFVFSLMLLMKHNRFIYEFILLSIPILHHGIAVLVKPSEKKGENFSWIVPLAMIALLIVLPCLTYGSQFKNRPEYPFSQINLPIGVAAFLNKLDTGGRILNEPNTGGYLQWALNGKYKIYMDMQMAVFNDRDFAFAHNALNDENTFRSFVRTYDPSFLSVSLNRTYFNDFISKFDKYKPIFFDDTEVLYVNAHHFPPLANAYALNAIDPYHYRSIGYETESRERLSSLLNEAMKMRNFSPGCGIANTIIANILTVTKECEKALPYADTVIRRYPDIANGYALRADALFGLERFQEAAVSYRTAIEKGAKKDLGNVYRNLHVSYVRLKEYKKAYRILSEFVNPFNLSADYKDIYELGMAAAAAGRLRDAINFLKIAQMKLPPDDAEYTTKIQENLSMLDPEGKKKYEQ